MQKLCKIVILINISLSFCYSQIKPILKSDSIPIFFKDTIPIIQVPTISTTGTFFSFGVIGSGNYNVYKGSFGIFEKGMSCSSFDNGSGFNFSGGIIAEIVPFTDFSLQLRMLLENKSGIMKSDYLLPIYNDRYAKTEHDLKITLYYYSLNLLLKYNFISHLYFTGGVSLDLPKVIKNQLTVKILSDDISYENGLMEKTFNENQIMNVSRKYSFKVGLGFDIPISSENLFISPEVGYDHPLNNIVSDSGWKVKSLSIAIILKLEL